MYLRPKLRVLFIGLVLLCGTLVTLNEPANAERPRDVEIFFWEESVALRPVTGLRCAKFRIILVGNVSHLIYTLSDVLKTI
jgi:hypothetical protein